MSWCTPARWSFYRWSNGLESKLAYWTEWLYQRQRVSPGIGHKRHTPNLLCPPWKRAWREWWTTWEFNWPGWLTYRSDWFGRRSERDRTIQPKSRCFLLCLFAHFWGSIRTQPCLQMYKLLIRKRNSKWTAILTVFELRGEHRVD